jgi:hypothetical protein
VHRKDTARKLPGKRREVMGKFDYTEDYDFSGENIDYCRYFLWRLNKEQLQGRIAGYAFMKMRI